MSDETAQTSLAYFGAMLVLLLAALAGFWDILWNGDGLTPPFALWTVLLWITLALPAALVAAVVAFIAEKGLASRIPAPLLAAAVAALVWHLALLMAFSDSLLGLILCGTLVALGAIGFLETANSKRDLRPIATRATLAILAILGLAACAPLLRGIVPRTVFALIAVGPIYAALAIGEPTRRLRKAAGVSLATLLAASLLAPFVESPREVPTTLRGGSPSRPNVVLIVLDTQRADYIGAYGHDGGLTPNLDALATESTVFEECFTTAGWTIPAHASLFTGLYPQSHGASWEEHRYLDDRFETLAEGLASAGYATAAFVANPYLKLANLDQGFDHFQEIGATYKRLKVRPKLERLGLPARFVDHGAVDGAGRVADFLKRRAPSTTRPLFLFVNLLEPHWPYFPPLKDRIDILGLEGSIAATEQSRSFYGPNSMGSGLTDDRTKASIRGLYAAAVQHQDREFARLLAAIDASLPSGDTLLIVTNDHGENLGEAGRWDHVFAINDHLVRAPVIVRHPAFDPGARIAGLCSQVDIPATVADVVGGFEPRDAKDARTLVPAHFVPRKHVFVAGDPYLGHFERMGTAAGFQTDSARWNATLRSARDERFKYLESSTGDSTLFDLAADPDETTDVSEQNPGRVTSLRAALRDWEAGITAYLPDPAASSEEKHRIDEEDLTRLNKLGYSD
ncbi:MAG: sulfatase [Myxococcota bacterium]|nr:sulfatase [Myxococcota bacterium]